MFDFSGKLKIDDWVKCDHDAREGDWKVVADEFNRQFNNIVLKDRKNILDAIQKHLNKKARFAYCEILERQLYIDSESDRTKRFDIFMNVRRKTNQKLLLIVAPSPELEIGIINNKYKFVADYTLGDPDVLHNIESIVNALE